MKQYDPPLSCGTCGRPLPGMAEPITPAQRRVLLFLQEYIRLHGVAPSFAEAAASLGFGAQSTVWEHVEELRKKGYIARGTRRRHRDIAILMEVE